MLKENNAVIFISLDITNPYHMSQDIEQQLNQNLKFAYSHGLIVRKVLINNVFNKEALLTLIGSCHLEECTTVLVTELSRLSKSTYLVEKVVSSLPSYTNVQVTTDTNNYKEEGV